MAGDVLLIGDEPDVGVKKINEHDHTQVGKQIPSEGILDGSVITQKIADKAVTGDKMADGTIVNEKIKDGSIGSEKFKPGTLSAVDISSTSLGFKNYIASGLKLDWSSGLNLKVGVGRANIQDSFVDKISQEILAIPANSHGLIHLRKDGTLGFSPFKYPTVDSNFLFAYNFSDSDPKTKVTDLTGNGYDLVGDGTLTDIVREDGHIGYGCSTGSLSGLKSTKTVSITGANKYTMIWAGIIRDNGVNEIPLCIGNSNQRYFQIIPPSGDLYFWLESDGVLGTIQPRVHALVNKMNVAIVDFDGYYQRFFFNGRIVGKRKITSTSTALITGPVFVGEYVNSNYRSVKRNVHCFVGMTTKVYTQEEIADMCASMGVANQYDKHYPEYPVWEGETAENHIWSFDETDGTTIADSGTVKTDALQGTAYNLEIIKSEIGLGMKRRFKNGNSSKIVLGNYKFNQEFSFFAVIELFSYQSENYVLGSYDGTNGCTFRINENGYVAAWSGKPSGTWYTGNKKFPLNKIAIIGYISDGSNITIYSNTIHGEKISGYTPDTVNNSLALGHVGGIRTDTSCLDGDMHHAFLINRKLTKLEIKQMFNCVNKKQTVEMKDMVLPIDSISLGMVKSSDNKLIDISRLPKYGVLEGPFVHNNKFFTGFNYFTTNQTVEIENPFGTTKIAVTAFKKQNAWSEHFTKVDYFCYAYNASVANGNDNRGIIWRQCTNDSFKLWFGSYIQSMIDEEWNGDDTQGWWGFLIEKLDDAIDVGIEEDLMFQIDV